jgi:hypothetical protein
MLPATLFLVCMATACGPSSRNSTAPQTDPVAQTAEIDPVIETGSTHAGLPDTASLSADAKPVSLLDLPVSDRGEIILSTGFYEAEFKSYCLQPGTPDPSARDAYLQAPLAGPRRAILETALRNSLQKPYLEQKNVQLLLWSIVSGSDFDRLAPDVKYTARQVLTSRQIFELKGGVMGVVKTVATVLPETGIGNSYNQMRNLFELGSSSYEAYERLAVLRQPSVVRYPDYKKEQWYKQEGGYYLRYFPKGYQLVKVQVYVPEGLVDSTGKRNGEYLLFDPVATMAIPANSNAQRLGIGAPVADVIRKVIEIQRETDSRRKPTRPAPVPDPKPVGKGGTTR